MFEKTHEPTTDESTEQEVSAEDPFSKYVSPASPFALSIDSRADAPEGDGEVASLPSSGEGTEEGELPEGGDEEGVVEVLVGWGTSVLEVRQLPASVGLVLAPELPVQASGVRAKDRRGRRVQPDGQQTEVIRVPSDLLVGEREVLHVRSGASRVLLDPRQGGTYVERRGRGPARQIPFGQIIQRALPSDAAGMVEVPLVRGATITLEVAGLWLRLEAGQLPRERFRKLGVELGALGYFAGSLLSFAGLLTSLAYFTPYQGLEDETGLDRDRVIMLQQYLTAAAIRERETPPPVEPAGEEAGGEASAPAPGSPGEAGKPGADPTPRKLAVKGPADNRAVHLSRQETLALARDWGMIGLLNSASGSDAPFSAFSRDAALGSDDVNAQGKMWAMTIGEAAGQNGLFLSGPDLGGLHGPGTGVGIEGISSSLGTLGHCDPSSGRVCSFGTSVGRSNGNRKPTAPILRAAKTELSGAIPPAVVQRIVRQNFGRFRFCYEQGLARNPNLEGRVAVRFVIDRTGAVSMSSALGGGLPDSKVSSCVAQAFYGLSFPPPDHGIVTVTYPLLFSPG